MHIHGNDDNLRLDGKWNGSGEWRFLRCGPLTAYFDPETAALRRVCLGETELVRAIYVAVRDHNWNTIAPQLADVDLTEQDAGFHLMFHVRHRERDIDFAWRGDIIGEASGRIRFQMDGKALSAFRRNRIGFCVLHPVPACVGKPCIVQTTDGRTERGTFPDLIAPHQPFQNLRSLAHEAMPDVWVDVAFEGDVFEMEDQRNWTDASYKTYCTPLALPYPVLVPAGTEVRQAVMLALVPVIKFADVVPGQNVSGREERTREVPGTEERTRLGGAARQTSFGREAISDENGIAAAPDANAEARQTPVTLSFTLRDFQRLPLIGLSVASHGKPFSEREIALLRPLNLSHLRLDLTPSQVGWKTKLRQANAEARAIGAELEIALFLTDDAEAELTSLAKILPTLPRRVARPGGPRRRKRAGQEMPPYLPYRPVVRWIIFHVGEKVTGSQWVQMARQILGPLTPDVPIGAGTNAYFVELNRERPALDGLDFVSYSLNPQVHAFDNASLVENLQAQADTVRSARAFCGDLPLVVSPVTLRPRFNPDATGNAAPSAPDELPFAVDLRQMSLFGVGWTLGSLKALCEAGVHSVTYYETTGWRGLMETDAGSPLPDKFPSTPGEAFPLYYVLWDICERGAVLPITCSDPLRVQALALIRGRRIFVLCANLTPFAQSVDIALPTRCSYPRLWMLDAKMAEMYRRHPEYALTPTEHYLTRKGERNVKAQNNLVSLEMPPYAYARLRLGLPGR
jgi:hypothetical protein